MDALEPLFFCLARMIGYDGPDDLDAVTEWTQDVLNQINGPEAA